MRPMRQASVWNPVEYPPPSMSRSICIHLPFSSQLTSISPTNTPLSRPGGDGKAASHGRANGAGAFAARRPGRDALDAAARDVHRIPTPALRLLSPLSFVISAYQLLFAASTALFELPPEYMEKVSFLKPYQDLLSIKCNFLMDVQGRGLFYIFQGLLWAGFASRFASLTDLALTVLMVFIGVLHVAMHYGIGPAVVVAAMRL